MPHRQTRSTVTPCSADSAVVPLIWSSGTTTFPSAGRPCRPPIVCLLLRLYPGVDAVSGSIGMSARSALTKRLLLPRYATCRGVGASDLPLVIVEEHGDLAGVGDTVRLVCRTVHHRTGLHSHVLAIDKDFGGTLG